MNKVFGVFGTIGHGLKVGAVATWHLLELIGHDADVVFIDTLKAAQVLGYDKAHLYAAVERAKVALEQYEAGKVPEWTADVVATLQHQFVTDSLIERFGFSAPVAHTLTVIVSKLFAAGSGKLTALIDAAVAHVEAEAGIAPASPRQVGAQG